jgi:asparagine synthase (glutamine-hydrolysing)
MCGINGFFNYSNQQLNDATVLIQKMNRCIAHRGPDGSGIWKNETDKIYLGHQRLSIIDLSTEAAQPMISESGNVIVFNGEIYNYRELRKHTGRHYFKSKSDTEVLLYLYEKYGTECLQLLDGMFAFALWDTSGKELFIARDRAGEKPFYYSVQNGIFAFSSEIKSLLELPWIKPQLDETAFYHFLTFNQLAPPFTMFKGIEKLPPACMMRVKSNGIFDIQPYWEVSYDNNQQKTEEDWTQETYDLLEQSVKSRMVSDVPVGAFLSGGVDSSAVVAHMSRISPYRIKTYSIGFENQPAYDELDYARKISVMFNTEHFEKTVTADEIAGFVPLMAGIFDEPLADPTCIPIYFISQKARSEGTIVVLTGDGSDEIYAGYRNYLRYLKFYPAYHRYVKLPAGFKKIMAHLARLKNETSPLSEMLSRAALNQEFFWGAARSFKESAKKKFLSKEFRQRSHSLNSYDVIQRYRSMFDNIKSVNATDLDWMCYLGFKMNDANRYLMRADRLGMAHSVETRAPFMSHQVVNHALNIPAHLKMKNGEPKYVLKKSLEKILPHEILYRRKMGFSVPLREWAGGYMAGYVQQHLKTFASDTGLFDAEGLSEITNQIKAGSKSNVNDLFTLYFLMAWFKRWIKY